MDFSNRRDEFFGNRLAGGSLVDGIQEVETRCVEFSFAGRYDDADFGVGFCPLESGKDVLRWEC